MLSQLNNVRSGASHVMNCLASCIGANIYTLTKYVQ